MLRIGLAVGIVVLACGAFLTGCGSSTEETSGAPMPSAQGRTAKMPASGPAISDKLSFDQLTLDSSVTKVTDKNGLVYLMFAYTDMDGKVYKCKMPQAMGQGAYPPQEWLRTFTVYRLPDVIKQKRIVKKRGENVNDFPFIAPRGLPSVSSQPASAPPAAQASRMPALPPLPAPAARPMPPINRPRPSGMIPQGAR